MTAAEGSFLNGFPIAMTWHHDGSFFVAGYQQSCDDFDDELKYNVWNFATDAIINGWNTLWNIQGDNAAYNMELSKLAVRLLS